MNILYIIEGAIKTALKIDESIAVGRIENACKKCYASHSDGEYTGTCMRRNGGCGCNTKMKAHSSEECPLKVWGTDKQTIDLNRLKEINEINNFEQ